MKTNSESRAENQFLIKENNVWEVAMCCSPQRNSRSCGPQADTARGAWRLALPAAGALGASGPGTAGVRSGGRQPLTAVARVGHLPDTSLRRGYRGQRRQPHGRWWLGVAPLRAYFQTQTEVGQWPCWDLRAPGGLPLGSQPWCQGPEQPRRGATQRGVFGHTAYIREQLQDS